MPTLRQTIAELEGQVQRLQEEVVLQNEEIEVLRADKIKLREQVTGLNGKPGS